jgi:hypothetical protein
MNYMQATAILAPRDRTIRGNLLLFLRLRVVRQSYDSLRPFGDTPSERARFHLAELQDCWAKVVEFQRVLGLEDAYFTPREQFEKIYVISAFAERELQGKDNTVLDFAGSWQLYRTNLEKLSHDLNPFEFTELCSRCFRALQEFTRPSAPPTNLIPLPSAELARLQGIPVLRMQSP